MNLLLLIGCLYLSNLQAVSSYWEDQFSSQIYTTPAQTITTLQHHSQQNMEISRDFFRTLTRNGASENIIKEAIMRSQRVIEVGCGSGEMGQYLKQGYSHITYIGLDISKAGIEYASLHNNYTDLAYFQFDCLQQDIKDTFGIFDLAICSNTLEHFKQPFVLLDRILQAADACIILVPYKQPVTDGYEMEGGAGHVFTFDENSFGNYTVHAWFTFKTSGWQYSSQGEPALQMVALVSSK